MAFEMDGKYWRIADEIYDNGRYLRVIFHKYENEAARRADINSFDKLAKPYYIQNEEDDKAYTNAKAAGKDLDSLKAWLYEKVPTILEGEPPLRDEDGFILIDTKNFLLIDGRPTIEDQRKSFFATAEAA